jgi:hypothetical protein
VSYFHLTDDVHVAERWHLGEFVLPDGTELWLKTGQRIATIEPSCEVHRLGRELDFCLTSFGEPVARSALAAAMASVAGDDLQRLPLAIRAHPGFEALNATRLVDCLDEQRSSFTKWTAEDHRPELAGQYRMVPELHLDPARVPDGAHFFRVWGWRVALIVSAQVRAAMERHGCVGARFEEVA